ncbi:MAG: amino acid adenylation domain-containing protein [Actinophytocola sp.]|nr:amino acid adenylation domain-containing protein [Actinophytocola sp.]
MPLHEHVEHLADDAPDRVVLTAGAQNLTAAELDQCANRIARMLLDLGVCRGDLVGVALPRDITLVPSLVGVLKCGATYVPIDPHLPRARIAAMLDDSGARYVLVDHAAAQTDPYNSRTCADPHGLDLLTTPVDRPHVDVGNADAAYLIYTSGSTGRPKGVIVEHGSLDNLVRGWATAIPFPAGATMSSLATVAFDIFLAETILPMIYGLRVALATDKDVESPAAIAAFLARERVTAMQVTPSRLAWLLADKQMAAELRRIRLLIVGGEAFPPPLLAAARGRTRAEIYNVYGPTEATVWTSAKLLTEDEPITIGQPIPNVAYRLVGDGDSAPAVGGIGELCISGAALARGYFGDPEQTSERFGTSRRCYRTGDLARQLDQGELQIVGRVDQQIKIDGYRVELTEIEAVLAAAPGVAAAVVVPLDGGASRTLAGWLTPASVDADAVWKRAAEHLPRFMMPSTLVSAPVIPLSPAGKTDRRAVETLLRERISATTAQDPLEYISAAIARWVDGPVDCDTASVMDLGIGSLTIARLAAEIACRYHVRLELSEMIQVRSLRQLADIVRKRAL